MKNDIVPEILPQYKPFFSTIKRYNVVYGGRGKGATWSIARGLLYGSLYPKSKLRILCTREFQNSINESVYHTLVNQIDMLGLSEKFEIQKTSITSCTGTEFIFKGLRHNIDSIKSMEGIDVVWVAEADKVPQESWDKLIPTIRAEGSCFYIDFNTDSDDDPVYKMFVTNQRNDAQVLFQTYNDNPHFPEVLRRDMEHDKETDYEKYLWIWEGQTRSFSDSCIYHGKWREDEFDTPDDAQFYHGLDWGFANDPIAAIRCFVQGDRLYIDAEAGGVGVEITETPKLLEAIPTFQRWRSLADSARPELVSYMRQHGYPEMRSAKKGKGSIEDGIAKIRGFREVIIHPRCKHTIEEFKSYKYKRNSLTGDITPIPEDKHNHWMDALRYALEPLMKSKTYEIRKW